MQNTPPPVIAVWDTSASAYVRASASVCVSAGDSPGALCGGEVSRRLGGVPLCAEHYDRALYDRRAIFRQEDEDYGWSFNERRWDADAAEVVYYLLRESDGLIKIGTSTRFLARLGQHRAEHGTLHVLLTLRGDRQCERDTHLKFRDLQVWGEWFRPGKPLVEWILEARRRQEKIVPPSLIPGTVALSDVVPLVKAARRRQMRAARMQRLP